MVSVDLDLAATFVPRLRHVCATFVPRLCHVATCVAFLPQDRAITLQQLLRVVDFSKEMGPLKKCWCPYRSHAEAMQNLRDRDEQSPLNAKDLRERQASCVYAVNKGNWHMPTRMQVLRKYYS